MSDNLFDRLFELFQTNDSVNWRLGEEITKSLAGPQEPIEPQLAEEFEELALAAQLRLAGLEHIDLGAGTVPYPIDRSGWAAENTTAYAYLIEPLAHAMQGGFGGAESMAPLMAPLGPALLGMQAGTMVGFMSHRVMGQFDTALPPLDSSRSYLVVPNVEAFAREHDLDPRQVRLWATLHELAYFTLGSVDSLRARLTGSVQDLFGAVEFDPTNIMDRLNEMQDPAQMEDVLSESEGLSALFGGEPQPGLVSDIQAVASFIEGYGDFVVRAAGAEVLPDLDAIEAAHAIRRAEPNQAVDQLGQVVGLKVRRSQASEAAALCGAILERWGPEALNRLWEAPENLPHLEELEDPVGWAARVLLE